MLSLYTYRCSLIIHNVDDIQAITLISIMMLIIVNNTTNNHTITPLESIFKEKGPELYPVSIVIEAYSSLLTLIIMMGVINTQ